MVKRISIIIPVFNAENSISELLDSIKIQSNKEFFEVILVNNGSSDSTPKIINEFISRNKELKIILLTYIEKQSSYAARNFGVRNCYGNILAFTDSDCILSNNYIDNILEFFAKNEFSNKIIAGSINLELINKKNIWESFDKACYLQNSSSALRNRLVTANMIVYKELFHNIGFFLEIKSTGDSEWSERAIIKGCQIQFVPEINVSHPTRKTFEEIKNKFCRIGYGKGQRWDQGLIILVLVYFLKIFNYRTNIVITRKIFRHLGLKKIIKFNLLFHLLRYNQMLAAIKGFKEKDNN